MNSIVKQLIDMMLMKCTSKEDSSANNHYIHSTNKRDFVVVSNLSMSKLCNFKLFWSIFTEIVCRGCRVYVSIFSILHSCVF